MATHYETLGVAQTATADEIKTAYRKLAMQWHPDKNQGNAEATAKFKDISAAYEILGDENKRREYDFQQQNSHQFGPNVGGMHWNVNFNGHPFGPNGLDDFVAQIFGQHGFGNFRQPPRNRDVNLNMNISLEDVYQGKQTPIQFTTSSGRTVQLVIDIPRGIESGMKIRYPGQGDHNNTSMPPGDLYVIMTVADHPTFSRNGNNLECHAKIDAISAILGVKHSLTAINGSKITVTVPPGTQQGARLRVQGSGMPLREKNNAFGDLIIVVDVVIPTDLNADVIDQLKLVQSKRSIDNL